MKRFKDYFKKEREKFIGSEHVYFEPTEGHAIYEMLNDLAEKVEELEGRLDADPEAESQEIMKSTMD